METQTLITKINGIEISAVTDENNNIFVPVKPICQAIGVQFEAQYHRMSRHYILSSVMSTMDTTGADGKTYEMVCLPVKHICGWLYSINPGKVAPEAKQKVLDYREEVNDILTSYFFGGSLRQIEVNQAEIRELENINALLTQERNIKDQLKHARLNLDKIRAARLDNQPTLF